MDADTATWLREARHARGLDVRTLAWSAGVAPAAVEAVERGTAAERFGRSLAAAWTWAIARALGLDAEPRLAALDGREQGLTDPAGGEPAAPEQEDQAEAATDEALDQPATDDVDEDALADAAPDAPPGGWDEGTLWLWAPPEADHEPPPTPDAEADAEPPPTPDAEVQGHEPAAEPAAKDPLVPPEPEPHDALRAPEDTGQADPSIEEPAPASLEEPGPLSVAASEEEPTQRLLTPPREAGDHGARRDEEPTAPLLGGGEDADDPTDGLDEPFEEDRSPWRSVATFAAGFALLVVAGLGVGALIAQLFDPGAPDGDTAAELAEGELEADDEGAPPEPSEEGGDPDAAGEEPAEQGEEGGEDGSQTGLGARALGGDPQAAPAPQDTTVQVLDGSEQGSAQAVIAALEAHGYQVIDSGAAAAAWDRTRMLVSGGAEDAAAGLLEREPRLPDAERNDGQLDEGVELHVIVGADWTER